MFADGSIMQAQKDNINLDGNNASTEFVSNY